MTEAFAAISGLLGTALSLTGGPLWVAELRKVMRGPEYVPGVLLAMGFIFACGLTLLGVMTWLVSIS